MKRYLPAVALFIATLLYATELFAQKTAPTPVQRSTTWGGDEPWMYPVAMPASPTIDQLNSLRLKTGWTESLGVTVYTSNAIVVPAEVASFASIVQWYSDRTGETQLPKALDRFMDGGNPGPGWGLFDTHQTGLSTHLTYRFTLKPKQITILHTEENGDVVAISLLGLEGETSINVLRSHSDGRALSQNGGPPAGESRNASSVDAGTIPDAQEDSLKRASRYPLRWKLDVQQPVQSHRLD